MSGWNSSKRRVEKVRLRKTIQQETGRVTCPFFFEFVKMIKASTFIFLLCLAAGSIGVMQNIIKQYSSLLETVDLWFQQTLKQFPQAIHCSSGCNGCCRGFFDITLLDAALVSCGYQQLPVAQREIILGKSALRLSELQQRWPHFNSPYLLNGMPDSEWVEMPEEDETACPFLADDGLCLIYSFRPMTCRLHGLPNIDFSGEIFSDTYCSLNFNGIDPLLLPQLRWKFRQTFSTELDLFQKFTTQLIGRPMNELDTLLPLVPLIDFNRTDWLNFPLYHLPDSVEQDE